MLAAGSTYWVDQGKAVQFRGKRSRTMHTLEMGKITSEFAGCWQAAGQHLHQQAQRQGLTVIWLKAMLHPPFLEHLSFSIGNQLFFVRVEDVERRLDCPGSRRGLMSISEGCKGHPCIMPMRTSGPTWTADRPGWGLLHATTKGVVDPVALGTDEQIEMTDWEVHDFAVQIVREQLKKDGRQIMSSQGNPAVDPSLWFVGDHGPEWVVVRVVRYPEREAERPANWARIAENCARLSRRGHFASVSVANADNSFEEGPESVIPLWRRGPMNFCYEGLVKENS